MMHSQRWKGGGGGVIIENEPKPPADKSCTEVIIVYSLEFQSTEALSRGKLGFAVTSAQRLL